MSSRSISRAIWPTFVPSLLVAILLLPCQTVLAQTGGDPEAGGDELAAELPPDDFARFLEVESRAMAGDGSAQLDLAGMYERGVGTMEDLIKAHVYFNLAASKGYQEAKEGRDRVGAKLSPDELKLAREEAANWKPFDPATAPPMGADLFNSAEAGDLEAVKALIASGSDVNEADEDGWTPLIFAAAEGHVEIVGSLLEAGAKVDAQTSEGATPLVVAILKKHPDVVTALLKAGADPSREFKDGLTPAMLAQASGDAAVKKAVPAPKAAAQVTIKPFGPATYYAKKTANVRKGPSTDSEVVASLRGGSEVTVTGQASGVPWYQIVTDRDVAGYVHSALLGKSTSAQSDVDAASASDTSRAPTQAPPASTPEIRPTPDSLDRAFLEAVDRIAQRERSALDRAQGKSGLISNYHGVYIRMGIPCEREALRGNWFEGMYFITSQAAIWSEGNIIYFWPLNSRETPHELEVVSGPQRGSVVNGIPLEKYEVRELGKEGYVYLSIEVGANGLQVHTGDMARRCEAW
jgi:ankyrin repeat protein